jgi:hypothetical protein
MDRKMRYIYSRIGLFIRAMFRTLFGDHVVRGVILSSLLVILLTASTIIGVKSIWHKYDPIQAEDPIESYDNVVEIVIGDDGEVSETESVAPSEEIE